MPSLRIEVLNSSTLRIVGGSGNEQVSAAIGGKYRFVTGTITATLPGGLTNGVGSVYITASDNAFGTTDPPDSLTNYSFAMEIRASGNPSTALWRKVGEVDVSSSSIVAFRPFGGPRVTSEFGLAATPDTASQPGVLVTGKASQTGNLIQARNNSGNTVFAVRPDGGVTSSGGLTLTGATTANRTLVSDGTGAMNLAQIGAAVIEAGLLPPTGALMPYAGATAPTGWLLCNAQTVTATSHPALHAVLAAAGYPYGGSGSTANVPDMRGRVAVGVGTHANVDSLADNEGQSTVSSRRPQHAHQGTLTGTASGGDHTHSVTAPQSLNKSTDGQQNTTGNLNVLTNGTFLDGFAAITGGGHTHSLSVSGTVGQTGVADAPAYQVLNYIIKT